MTRAEILQKMVERAPHNLFPAMAIGGSAKTLAAMEESGLISSQPRYRGNQRQRNWFLTEEQHANALKERP